MLVQEYMNDYEKIYSYVMMLFNKHYTHEPLRLIGVTLNNVKRKEAIIEQMNMVEVLKIEHVSLKILFVK